MIVHIILSAIHLTISTNIKPYHTTLHKLTKKTLKTTDRTDNCRMRTRADAVFICNSLNLI